MGNLIKTLDTGLINKYESKRVPYYTSYPTGGQWSSTFKHEHYLDSLKKSTLELSTVPMALYIHFPFCQQLCFYCCCIKVITKNRDNISRYLAYLQKEIDLFLATCESMGIEPDVREIHLGGGTPTYMKRHEFDRLINKLNSFVDLHALNEFVLEIDPRTATKEDMHYYLEKGINRISFGIQDFDPAVQKAINRVQPLELIEPLLSKDVRPISVSFDLIYGLPFSTRQSFLNTIQIVKQLNPDRLAVYNYDHTPEIHNNMKAIAEKELPDLKEKTFMYVDAVTDLLSAGYEYVGIDHFAKSSDSLAHAYNNKTIWRNLNGYTVGRDFNYEIGLGMSSIGAYSGYYAHNIKSLPDYYQSLDNNRFPVFRGVELNNDDVIRREVILTLLCRHHLEFADIESRYGIDFRRYFNAELQTLEEPIADGFAVVNKSSIEITGLGKIFAHHICKHFDIYLPNQKDYIRTHAAIKKQQVISQSNN